MERGVSLSEIARQAGLAKGTLSKLELGVGNPTIDTLYAIADVLEVSVSQLVSRRTSHVAVERAKDAHWTGSEGLEARPLSHVFGAGLIETYELRLSSIRREAEPHPPGTLEHVFVISGKALLGPLSAPETLSRGDSIRFPGDEPHVYESLRGRAHLHLVMSIPQPAVGALEALRAENSA
jgi:transcriptional regulator with XRE-family HTH domain